MNAQQRTFLIEARNYAIKKCHSEDIQKVTDYEMKLFMINGLSETVRNRVAEELFAQGLIEVERKRVNIDRIKLTTRGIEELDTGLRTAGRYINSFDIEINKEFIEAINKIAEEIKSSNLDNKQIWLELSESLQDEIAKEKPRKNVLALLLGSIIKGTDISANVSTILTNAGIKANDIANFVSGIVK